MDKLRIAEHAPSPGGRFISDGPFSGELFRRDVLTPALRDALQRGEKLTIDLNGTSGYGSSFLEEAFGGLIRRGIFPADQVRKTLIFSASPLYMPYKALAERYVREAKPEAVAA